MEHNIWSLIAFLLGGTATGPLLRIVLEKYIPAWFNRDAKKAELEREVLRQEISDSVFAQMRNLNTALNDRVQHLEGRVKRAEDETATCEGRAKVLSTKVDELGKELHARTAELTKFREHALTPEERTRLRAIVAAFGND